MSDQKIDFIRKYTIKNNDVDMIVNFDTYSLVRTIAVKYVDAMDNFLAESIIKTLPKEISELYLINKKEVLKVVLRDVAQKPYSQCMTGSGASAFYSKSCRVCSSTLEEHQKFCSECGTRIDWSTDE